MYHKCSIKPSAKHVHLPYNLQKNSFSDDRASELGFQTEGIQPFSTTADKLFCEYFTAPAIKST